MSVLMVTAQFEVAPSLMAVELLLETVMGQDAPTAAAKLEYTLRDAADKIILRFNFNLIQIRLVDLC